MIRHLVFFEAMADVAESDADPSTSDLYAELQAAFCLLRLLDEWIDCPALVFGLGEGAIRIRLLIEKVPNLAVRHIFRTIVSVMTHWDGGSITSVVAPFVSYAWLLEERERFVLAADVLKTAVEIVDPLRGTIDRGFAARLYRRLGDIALRQRQFDQADEYYEDTLRVATAGGEYDLALDARIRRATVQLTRGDLGDAEVVLTAIIKRAREVHLPRAESYGRRVRGAVMQRRGRAGEALCEFYKAYTLAPDDLEREWLLGDIAVCALDLGLRDVARTIHQALAKTAHTPAAKSLALVNLLEIAVFDNDPATFRAIWLELQHQELPRDQALYAALYRAKGIEWWHGSETAKIAYAELATRAQLAGAHHVEFQAMDALQRLEQGQGHNETTPAEVLFPRSMPFNPTWGKVAEAVEEACQLRLHAFRASGGGTS